MKTFAFLVNPTQVRQYKGTNKAHLHYVPFRIKLAGLKNKKYILLKMRQLNTKSCPEIDV
jgi:hypothetical protein